MFIPIHTDFERIELNDALYSGTSQPSLSHGMLVVLRMCQAILVAKIDLRLLQVIVSQMNAAANEDDAYMGNLYHLSEALQLRYRLH